MKIFFLILCSIWAVEGGPRGPEVCARDGCIRGVHESGRLKPYEAFYGIPYAEPPVGKLRFENPVPFSGWSGYWDASFFKGDCYQKNYYYPNPPTSGSEDCLYLNVYRPNTWSSKKKLPVLVYIHGGAYVSFSSDPAYFGPEFLMDNGGVILVTMNYRLGLFGFMCSGDRAVKGNFGLKDQQMALEWVSRNIEAFGGDSQSVTLSGESAGGVSTNLHLINSKSQAFIHRGILLSGNVLAPFVYPIDDVEAQMRTAANISGIPNWDTASTSTLAKQFKKVPALTLVNAVDGLFTFAFTPPVPLRFCIEGDWEGAFLTEDPRITWAEGNFVHKPILTGATSEEGVIAALLTQNETRRQIFNENIYTFLPIQYDFHPRFTSEVLKFYFGKKDYIDDSNEDDYFRLFSDRMFNYPHIKLVKEYVQYADVEENPIYLYNFAFQGKYSFYKYFTGVDEIRGVSHLDDLIYLFSMSAFFPLLEPGTPEGKMCDIFVRTIVTFAQTGKVKTWRPFRPCTLETSEPFCDQQVFTKYTASQPNEVMVSVSNQIDEKMYKMFLRIDKYSRVDKSVNLHMCPKYILN